MTAKYLETEEISVHTITIPTVHNPRYNTESEEAFFEDVRD